MRFKGDIIITDPCYIIRDKDELTEDDWQACDYGENMEALGIKNYLCRNTIYGDWSCTTFRTENDEVLGEFCADAGLVAVFLLDEVLKYNPNFDYHTERPWTTTLIKDFDGDIELSVVPFTYIDEDTNEECEDSEVRVVGTGNINFYTTQTGF